MPPVDVLAALADMYKRPLNWFLENRTTLDCFRYRNMRSRVRLSNQRHSSAGRQMGGGLYEVGPVPEGPSLTSFQVLWRSGRSVARRPGGQGSFEFLAWTTNSQSRRLFMS